MPEVRVIGEEGEQLGVLAIQEAIRSARERGLDLVEVAPTAQPPVCRIIDFGKFQYEQKKKANEAKKKQVTITVKEVKFRPGTDDHDYEYRMKHAREWLQEGDKVKATIWFRGREMTHRELGSRILLKLENDLVDVGEVEARPRMEGNQMFIIFGPKRHKTAVKAESSGTSQPPSPPSGASGPPPPSGTSGPPPPSGTSGPPPSGTSGPPPSGTSGPPPSGTSGPPPSGTPGPPPSAA